VGEGEEEVVGLSGGDAGFSGDVGCGGDSVGRVRAWFGLLAEAWMEPRDLPLSFSSTRAALAATTKMGLTLPWSKPVSR